VQLRARDKKRPAFVKERENCSITFFFESSLHTYIVLKNTIIFAKVSKIIIDERTHR
jgi:hypothetical protein